MIKIFIRKLALNKSGAKRQKNAKKGNKINLFSVYKDVFFVEKDW